MGVIGGADAKNQIHGEGERRRGKKVKG